MLSLKTAQLAIDMAQELEARNLVAIPAHDSMLSQLNASACVAQAQNEFGATEFTITAEQLVSMTGVGPNGESVHTTHLTEMERGVGDSLIAHINFARTNVRGLVVQVSERLTAYITAQPSESEYTLKVIRRDLPAPLKEPALVEALLAYGQQDHFNVEGYVPLPEAEEADYLQYLKTGDPAVDEAIALWVNSVGEDVIKTVFLSLFSDKGHPRQPGARLTYLLSGSECINEATAAYLFASRLLMNPPKGVQMNLSEYNVVLGQIRDQSALNLCGLLRNYNIAVKNGVLVRYYTPTEVVVNAEVYDQWIEGGGSDSILFGAQLVGRGVRTLRELDEGATEFAARWQRECVLTTSTERNLRQAKLVGALREYAIAVVMSNQKLAFEHLVGEEALKNPSDIHQLKQYQDFVAALDLQLAPVREADFRNVWSLVTRVICNSLFPYTDALQILTGIDEAVAQNPELNAQEALLFSLIDLAADYACGLFEIKS